MKHTTTIRRMAIAAAVLAASLALVPTALAKGPSGTGGSGSGGSAGSGLSLVLMNSTDGLPHYGQSITFNVSTSATTQPYVRVNCYQGSTWVYTSTVGYYASYPFWQYFTLSGSSWTGGAANCTATLFYQSGKTNKETDLASRSFAVFA